MIKPVHGHSTALFFDSKGIRVFPDKMHLSVQNAYLATDKTPEPPIMTPFQGQNTTINGTVFDTQGSIWDFAFPRWDMVFPVWDSAFPLWEHIF